MQPAGPPLIQGTPDGPYCAAGGFHIDPSRPVKTALITHAHAGPLAAGSGTILCTDATAALLRVLPSGDASAKVVRSGERFRMGEAEVSFHPSGHIFGSAQLRIENNGETWVFSGDYKLTPDPTCSPFEPLKCDVFVTEATFGLPIYRWSDPEKVVVSIREWNEENQERGMRSILFVEPVGIAQRLLAGLGSLFCHEAIERINRSYRENGVDLPASVEASPVVLAPVSAQGTPEMKQWMKQFGAVSTAFVSGGMRIRGTRRFQSVDRGFVLSDNADWPDIHRAIQLSGAESVAVSHGFKAPMTRWLQQNGRHAWALEDAAP
jgi:putative mRNA 3-end processing factor